MACHLPTCIQIEHVLTLPQSIAADGHLAGFAGTACPRLLAADDAGDIAYQSRYGGILQEIITDRNCRATGAGPDILEEYGGIIGTRAVVEVRILLFVAVPENNVIVIKRLQNNAVKFLFVQLCRFCHS